MNLSFFKFPGGRRVKLIELSIGVCAAVVAGIVFRFMIFIPYSVSDNSMSPTLIPGDRILTNRLVKKMTAGFWEPARGDLIVFRHPVYKETKSIKRVVAGQNDMIEIRDKQIIINGEPYRGFDFIRDTTIKRSPSIDPRDEFTPITIPSPGDTLVFSELSLREFDFAVSLMRQDWPNVSLEITCHLIVDGEVIDPAYFPSVFKITLNKDKKLDLSTMSWYNLNSLLNQLRTRFPEKEIDFRRTLFREGQEVRDYVVKEPCYFVMGDNWEQSYDSRFLGYVSRKSIVSKPLLIYWSKKPNTWIKINFYRILKFIS
ncbi:signal peptidase I [Fibrobacterota bacterium]